MAAAIAVAIALKVALCMNMPICIHASATYDDVWAVRAADFIAQGQWLGPYDDVTLIKNVGFPLWLALCIKMGVGYLWPTTMLYALAALLFTVALRPLLHKNWLFLVVFVVILFCPVSFATDTFQRIYRNSITAAQVLLVFAGYLGMYLRMKRDVLEGEPADEWMFLRTMPWALLSAVSLAWFWISREDSIWVTPFIVVATLVMLVVALRRFGGVLLRFGLCVLIVLPIAVTEETVRDISQINEQHYGVAVTSEINSGNFARLIKDLYSIRPSSLPANQRVACPHESLELAYEASPILASVKEQVEDRFYNWGDTVDNNPGDGEVNGGEFFWVIRLAAADAGVYSEERAAEINMTQAQYADRWYKLVANQLEDAFDSGQLQKRAVMPSSIMTPWRSEYAAQFVPTMLSVYSQALSYADVTSAPFVQQGSEDGIAYFESITKAQGYDGTVRWPFACTFGLLLIWVYRIFGSCLAVAGIVCAVLVLVRWITQMRGRATRQDLGPLVLVLAALFFSVFALIAGLTYSRISSFIPIAYYYYGSAAYPLLLAFNGLAVAGVLQNFDLKKLRRKRR